MGKRGRKTQNWLQRKSIEREKRKFQYTYFYPDRPQDYYGGVLEKVHEALVNKYKKVTKQRYQAKRIENYLREVKQVVKKLSEGEKQSDFERQFDIDIADRLTDSINNSKAWGNNQLHSNKIFFYRKHKFVKKGQKKPPFDDIFEQELGLFFSSFFDDLNKKQIRSFVVGRDSGEFNFADDLFDITLDKNGDIKYQSNRVTKKIEEKVEKAQDKIRKNLDLTKEEWKRKKIPINFEVQKQGKTDVQVGIDLKIKTDLSPFQREFAELIQGKKFSVKNWMSVKEYRDKNTKQVVKVKNYIKNGREITFGNTFVFKGIMGGFLDSGINLDGWSMFWRGMNYITGEVYPPNSMDGRDDPVGDVIQHFNHMRAIYEISGAGLTKKVDFIIWNDPYSENIYVQDIGTIFNNIVFEQDHRKNLFENVKIQMQYFSDDSLPNLSKMY